MQRRRFLQRLSIAPVCLGAAKSVFAETAKGSAQIAYMGAAQSRLGEHTLLCFNQSHDCIAEHALASRGHGFALSAEGHIAAIARRPADFFFVMDRYGSKQAEIQARPDRHFYGHGVYDKSGEYLYLTENDFDNARGVIGVYETHNNYARVDEFDSHGIGPHAIQFNRDASQLIVANGGIETHPNTGRKKLNLPTMQPSLAFIDPASGALSRRAKLAPEHHRNSIRHFAVGSDDTVYIGLQNQNADADAVLLATLAPTDSEIEKFKISAAIESRLDNYVGDICLDQSEQYLAASSPYGNSLVMMSLFSGETSLVTVNDVCALSPTAKPGQFMVSAGSGMICLVDIHPSFQQPRVKVIADFSSTLAWDNHILGAI